MRLARAIQLVVSADWRILLRQYCLQQATAASLITFAVSQSRLGGTEAERNPNFILQFKFYF
jgi:hypothetical protein